MHFVSPAHGLSTPLTTCVWFDQATWNAGTGSCALAYCVAPTGTFCLAGCNAGAWPLDFVLILDLVRSLKFRASVVIAVMHRSHSVRALDLC